MEAPNHDDHRCPLNGDDCAYTRSVGWRRYGTAHERYCSKAEQHHRRDDTGTIDTIDTIDIDDFGQH